MPTLLIVDDEDTIRIGLKSMVNRLLPHWEVIGSCEDAEQAWEQVNACSPDLAIIDIGMTGMSGLELALRLNNEKPEVNKIMLTGYDKFAYIQSALRSGVTDYLLKPVQRNELVEAFEKVEGILAEREYRRKLKLEKRISDWVIAQKTGSYCELEQLLNTEGLLGDDIRYGIILSFQYGSFEELEEGHLAPSARSWSAQLHDSESNIIKWVDVTISNVCEMTFVVVRNMSSLEQCFNDNEQISNRSSSQLRPIGYGELIDDLHLLPIALRQAQEMVYRNVQSIGKQDPSDEAERMNKLIVSIEMNDLRSVNILLEQWQSELGKAREQHPLWEFARMFRFISFFAGLQSSRAQSALLMEMNTEITRLSGRLLFTGDPKELLLAIDEFIERVSQVKPDLFDERKIIGKVKEIMRREFMNPEFSLEQAAQYVHLNATYLSELFKETTGRKFIDYLTDIRLDEARRILLETDMKMYEVCLSVGYTSSKYFSTLFRKKFEVTPTMYREGQVG